LKFFLFPPPWSYAVKNTFVVVCFCSIVKGGRGVEVGVVDDRKKKRKRIYEKKGRDGRISFQTW
jgi:hypothetical protein